jgi:hypothetical protein
MMARINFRTATGKSRTTKILITLIPKTERNKMN